MSPSAHPIRSSADLMSPSADPMSPSADPMSPSADPMRSSADLTSLSADLMSPSADLMSSSADLTSPSADPMGRLCGPLGGSTTEAGQTLAMYGIGGIAGSYLGGWLSDRVPPRLVMVGSRAPWERVSPAHTRRDHGGRAGKGLVQPPDLGVNRLSRRHLWIPLRTPSWRRNPYDRQVSPLTSLRQEA